MAVSRLALRIHYSKAIGLFPAPMSIPDDLIVVRLMQPIRKQPKTRSWIPYPRCDLSSQAPAGPKTVDRLTLDTSLATRQLVLQNDAMASMAIAPDNCMTRENLIECALASIGDILNTPIVEQWEYDWGLQRVWPVATQTKGRFRSPVSRSHPAADGLPTPRSLLVANSRPIHRTRTFVSCFDEQDDVDSSLFRYYKQVSGGECFLHFPLVRGKIVSGAIIAIVSADRLPSGEKTELAHAVANRLMSNLLTMELTIKSSHSVRKRERLEYRESLVAVEAQRDLLSSMLSSQPKGGGLKSSVERVLQEACQSLKFNHGYLSRHLERDDSHACLYEIHSESSRSKGRLADHSIVIEPSSRTWSSDECPFWGQVRDTLQPQAVDVEKLESRYSSFAAWHRRQGNRIVLCAPLLRVRRAIGCITLGSPSPDFGSSHNLATLSALTQHTSMAIRIAELADETQAVAIRGERSRMARDIHDNLAQFFTGIKIQCDAAIETQTKSNASIDQYLNRILQMATEGVRQARRTVGSLDAFSAGDAEVHSIEGMVLKVLHRFCDGTPLGYRLNMDSRSPALSEQELHELRSITHEAISNAQKHAKASTLTVSTRWIGNNFCLEIADDGQGLAKSAAKHDRIGHGLNNMKFRANQIGAQFKIEGLAGSGTSITVTMAARSE